jgi:hypothetical protein
MINPILSAFDILQLSFVMGNSIFSRSETVFVFGDPDSYRIAYFHGAKTFLAMAPAGFLN